MARKVISLSRKHLYQEDRQAEILRLWPLTAQAEAMTEKEMGRPAKWEQLLTDIAAVKQKYPKPDEPA